MKSEIRYCEDIGMFAFDRSISASCVHATEYCKSTCFNDKLYKLYPRMYDKDVRNEAYWSSVTGKEVRNTLKRKRKPTHRVRFMTRGEAISDFNDIDRVYDIVINNPDTEWWMPTRAWRNSLLLSSVLAKLQPLPNLHVVASTDITTTDEEWEMLRANGLSTMFYGDERTHTPLGERMFKCPKTWGHVKGACSKCKRGCFEGHGRVDVQLGLPH